MARKTVAPAVRLNNWTDVDDALRRIAEALRRIEQAEHGMQQAIDAAKDAAAAASKPLADEITALEHQIEEYVDRNREDMGKTKSRKLNFGHVGYRKSTKIILPKGQARIDEIIRQLKDRGMTDCIVTPPAKVSKDVLGKYPPNDIVAVGANVDVKDAFWYEVDRERIEEA